MVVKRKDQDVEACPNLSSSPDSKLAEPDPWLVGSGHHEAMRRGPWPWLATSEFASHCPSWRELPEAQMKDLLGQALKVKTNVHCTSAT